MSEDKLCPECGKPLGSNPECENCRKFKKFEKVVGKGPEEIKEEDAEQTVKEFEKWEQGRGKNAPADLFEKVRLLYNMVKDYINGEYTGVPWRTIAMVIFALLYVINPFDLIPDFIPGVGWVDDAAVVGLVIYAISEDLEDYKRWKELKQLED